MGIDLVFVEEDVLVRGVGDAVEGALEEGLEALGAFDDEASGDEGTDFRQDAAEENFIADALFAGEGQISDFLAMPEFGWGLEIAHEPAWELSSPFPMWPRILPIAEF